MPLSVLTGCKTWSFMFMQPPGMLSFKIFGVVCCVNTMPHGSSRFQKYVFTIMGHIKYIHLHSCKHKTVTLKLTLTLTDTRDAVLTLMLGYRRLRIYKLKRKIQN